MDSGRARSIQNALTQHLIIFVAGVFIHHLVLTNFSYAALLSTIVEAPIFASIESYFVLTNSSATVTGLLLILAYTILYSLRKLFVGMKVKELAVKPQIYAKFSQHSNDLQITQE